MLLERLGINQPRVFIAQGLKEQPPEKPVSSWDYRRINSMFLRTATLTACLAATLGTLMLPAEAQYYGGDWRYRDGFYNRHFDSNWSNRRGQYRRHWNRMSSYRRRMLENQLRAQWMQYKPGWQGNLSWNTYNDPAFFDYMYRSNPGLMTTLRTYLGF